MSIQEHLNKIRNAIKGSEVRESIAKGIETAYDDASEKDNANMEVKIARGTHPNLRSRLEEVDNKQQQTTAQLDQNEKELSFLGNVKADKSDIDDFNSRVDEIITTPAKGISEQEIIDARDGETSLGGNIRKIKSALDYQLKNEVVNGDFSNGLDNWYIENSQYVLQDGVFEIVNTGSSSLFLWQITTEIKSGHKYYFYLDVEEPDENIQFYIRSGNQATLGIPNSSNSIRGTGTLKGIVEATQDDTSIRIYTFRDNVNLNTNFKVNGFMMIDLTKSFGVGNEPTLDKMNELIESSGWFDGKRLMTTKEVIKYFDLEETSGKVNTLEQEAVTARYGKNLYNPANNISGRLDPSTVSNFQTISEELGRTSQKIKIDNQDDIIMIGIRTYSIVDINGIVVKSLKTIPEYETHIIPKSEIPSNSYYLWVSTYDRVDSSQVEKGNVLSAYKPYGIEGFYIGEEKVLDYPIQTGFQDNKELEYTTYLTELDKSNLQGELNALNTNASSAINVRANKEVTDREEISIRDGSTNQKLILNLHKRENDGYDVKNDVYLPSAEDDFSDVQITNEKNEILPYRIIYQTNEFDIIADSRLGEGETFADSENRMISVKAGKISVSEDNGINWTALAPLSSIARPIVVFVAEDDTMFFSAYSTPGILYRSEAPYNSYTSVLDISEGYTGVSILQTRLVQHPDGELFLGGYQSERIIRIYKSIDGGITWDLNYSQPDKYQHIHGMYVDKYSTPVAIYAGLDGGGGILKTVDKGENWIDLRAEFPNIPQSTDFGVTYSDASGYRLLSGETSIVGGHSIIKTSDDANFEPVLSVGSGFKRIEKMGGKLFAGTVGTRSMRTAGVFVSHDDGENWEQAYSTSPLNDSAGANDGFRLMTPTKIFMGSDGPQIISGVQSSSRSPLRIIPNGSYAEIIVEVPSGSETLFIETGYAYPNRKNIVNDTDSLGEKLVHFNLNEGGSLIKESVSGEIFRDDFEWENGGKHLSYFHPYITSPVQAKSVLVKTLNGYEIDSSLFDTTDGVTISFWGKIDKTLNINIFETDLGDLLRFNNERVYLNNTYLNFRYMYPTLPGAINKHDLVIFPDGKVQGFTNGQLNSLLTNNTLGVGSGILDAIQNSSKMKMLNSLNRNGEDFIQNFSIRKGVIPEAQLYSEYNSFVKDNMGD